MGADLVYRRIEIVVTPKDDLKECCGPREQLAIAAVQQETPFKDDSILVKMTPFWCGEESAGTTDTPPPPSYPISPRQRQPEQAAPSARDPAASGHTDSPPAFPQGCSAGRQRLTTPLQGRYHVYRVRWDHQDALVHQQP